MVAERGCILTKKFRSGWSFADAKNPVDPLRTDSRTAFSPFTISRRQSISRCCCAVDDDVLGAVLPRFGNLPRLLLDRKDANRSWCRPRDRRRSSHRSPRVARDQPAPRPYGSRPGRSRDRGAGGSRKRELLEAASALVDEERNARLCAARMAAAWSRSGR